MASIFDTIGDWLGLNKGKATIEAAGQNKDLITQLGQTGRPIIEGIQSTTGDYLNYGKSGADLYADALGINGPEAAARAREAFTTSPGYQFGLEQGEDALMRRASALGNLQSGQTSIDLLKHGVHAANSEWNNWLNDLGGFTDIYGSGVQADNTAAGLGLDFESGLTSGLMGANNQRAAGKEAGQGAMLDALGTIVGIGSRAFGYGGFGGQKGLQG